MLWHVRASEQMSVIMELRMCRPLRRISEDKFSNRVSKTFPDFTTAKGSSQVSLVLSGPRNQLIS